MTTSPPLRRPGVSTWCDACKRFEWSQYCSGCLSDDRRDGHWWPDPKQRDGCGRCCPEHQALFACLNCKRHQAAEVAG